MTKHELIDAYVRGRLGRRDFVRQLTALGVSAAAALAYAQSLSPGAAAAGVGGGQAGFVMRAQPADEDYGVACLIASILEAVEALLEALAEALAALAAGLDQFGEDDFPSLEAVGLNTYAELQTLSTQMQEQVDALTTIVEDQGGTAPAPQTVADYETVDQLLGALAGSLNEAAALFAGVIPAVEDGEIRQTLTNIGLAVARAASFANVANGASPSPSAFESPSCP